jgi:glycyl-tRNA synthetase
LLRGISLRGIEILSSDAEALDAGTSSALPRMDDVVSLCARRGFIWQSSEIYGGINGFWDYGPLGVELKNNLKALWWQRVVRERDDVEGIDSSIIAHPRTWEASGHVEHFSDPLIDCRACKKRMRADQLDDAGPCPSREGTSQHDWTEARNFNLMLKTFIGAQEDAAATAFLRAETCQSIFLDAKRVRESARQKIPFGIAQIGKAFRNEINPRNFTFRSREFEQAELEFFCHVSEREKWFEHWLGERVAFHHALGLGEARLRVRPHRPDELAHYAHAAADIEFLFPFGWQEIEGVHDRGDWDLRRHFNTFYDDAGNIGRRYRRQDEVGTPFCVTYDFESENDHCVTVRERDSMSQARIPAEGILAYLRDRLEEGL